MKSTNYVRKEGKEATLVVKSKRNVRLAIPKVKTIKRVRANKCVKTIAEVRLAIDKVESIRVVRKG